MTSGTRWNPHQHRRVLNPWFWSHLAIVWCLVASMLCACGGPKRKAGPVEVGFASWYGKKFHGRQTACGERYDMHRLTAAHPSYPFGTVVLVTNLKNGRQVKVRINDRGPFVRGRIIDLSYSAAKQLKMVADGVVKVRVKVIKWGE